MRIKCFSMVKDEIDIIEDWVRYAIHIFGPGNVYVLDNESTDGTEAVLRHYRPAVWSETVAAGVESQRKGQLIGALMHEHKRDCDLLVPLDGDEFIGLENSWNKAKVIETFQALDIQAYGRFKFTLTYQVIPSVDEMTFPVRLLTDFSVTSYEFFGETYKDFAKTFYAADAFVATDTGNHYGNSTRPGVCYTDLWLYHYQARSLNQYRLKALKGAAYTNFWKNYKFCRHWQEAYKAHVEGRFAEYFEATHRSQQRHRRIMWPAAELRALDSDPTLPARFGPYEASRYGATGDSYQSGTDSVQ